MSETVKERTIQIILPVDDEADVVIRYDPDMDIADWSDAKNALLALIEQKWDYFV